MKRRSLLKMIGVSPALLVPWKPATEQIAPPPPPAEPEKLTLHEAMNRVDWDKELRPAQDIIIDQSRDPFLAPLRAARSYSATGMSGFSFDFREETDRGIV